MPKIWARLSTRSSRARWDMQEFSDLILKRSQFDFNPQPWVSVVVFGIYLYEWVFQWGRDQRGRGRGGRRGWLGDDSGMSGYVNWSRGLGWWRMFGQSGGEVGREIPYQGSTKVVSKFTFLLQPNQKYYITQYGELDFWLRWKMIILPILITPPIRYSLGSLGECSFWMSLWTTTTITPLY